MKACFNLRSLLSTWLGLLRFASSTSSTTNSKLTQVSLRDVPSITLYGDQTTLGNSPIAQLECTGGSAQGLYQVQNMTCVNIAGKGEFGTDELNWRCSATLPEEFKLGSTDVSCEAWRDPQSGKKLGGDQIVNGSCGVRYILMLTDAGEARYPGHLQDPKSERSVAQYLFWTIFIGTGGYILYSIIGSASTDSQARNDTRARRPRYGINGAPPGNDNDDHDDDDYGDHPSTGYSQPPCSSSGRTQPWLPAATMRLGANSRSSRIDTRPGASSTTSNNSPRGASNSSFTTMQSSASFGGTSHR